jgi:hypothetical protein
VITRTLARLTGTPKYEAGMQAFDVKYRTPEGENETVIATYGPDDVGNQIRQALFEAFPEATDYTFTRFDYLSFQMRVLAEAAIHTELALATANSAYIDEAELR